MEDSDGSANHIVRTQLPIARVKKIFRLDPNCSTISVEGVQLLTLATEHFIGVLAKAAYGQAVFDKRKTLQLRDLEFCIKNYETFSFLDGTLDGWPETKGRKRDFADGLNVTMAGILDANDEQEDLNADGLNDEMFGFDESLEGTGSPSVCQTAEKLNCAVTAWNTKMAEVVAPKTQSFQSGLLGHYGYCFPMNSTFVPLKHSAEVETDNMRSKQGNDEMEIDTTHIMID